MKTLLILFFIGTTTISFAQEKFFVNAPNGLSCRLKPQVDATKTGKLPYGSIVELIHKTPLELSITDNDKVIKGHWVKVKFSNFPFIVSTTGDIGYDGVAYVFDGYLEPLNKATIEIKDLTKDQFDSYQSSALENGSDRTKITDFTKIKNTIGDKVSWHSLYEGHSFIDSIQLDNGQILKGNKASDDYYVIAYYPKEEILLFEGGHSSELSISIKTGETLETVGNPEYIITSPNGKMRLNGSFPGQECSDYFFQEIKDGKLTYLTNFGWGSILGDDVCNFKDFSWINHKQFVYSYLGTSTGSDTGVVIYKKGTISRIKTH